MVVYAGIGMSSCYSDVLVLKCDCRCFSSRLYFLGVGRLNVSPMPFSST